MSTLSKVVRVSAAMLALAVGLFAAPARVAYATGGAVLTVNSNSDADNGSDGVCTLREAMAAALNNADHNECANSGSPYGDDSIVFAVSGSTTITMGSNLPAMLFASSGALSIDGANGGSPITIDGAGSYHPFDVSPGVALDLSNLTIQNASNSSGGAIANAGTVVLSHTTFLGNTAPTSDGGAIVNLTGTLTISNSTFSGNSASYGGAILLNGGTASIYNSTFSGNSASSGGSALGLWNNPSLTMYNSILANRVGLREDCWNGSGAATLAGDHNIVESTTGTTQDCSSITTSSSAPSLGTLAGSPASFPLQAGSPALDAGNDTVCGAAPVNNTSENGVTRPQDGDANGAAVCDIGAYEKPSFTSLSTGSKDGWVLESSETSGKGGSRSTSGYLLLGDDAGNRQYRSVMSFVTSGLPDTATITKVTLRVKKKGVTGGGNPLSTFRGFQADVKNGFFGGSPGLENSDFKAAASITVGPSTPPLVGGWYTIDLTSAKDFINLLTVNGGVTQVRLRFSRDDNNNLVANYLSLRSGNDATPANRPQLIVQYYVP